MIPDPRVKLADLEGIDLMLVGSRGYGPMGRVLLGSVSSQLMHAAPCPVIVVPRGAAGVVETAGARAGNVRG